MKTREVDGMKVSFVQSESYFEGFHTPSMHSTAKATGAKLVLLLAPGVAESDLSDDDVRGLVAAIMEHNNGNA